MNRKRNHEPYMPRIITTVGQRPACLVNASVTYVGNDKIYAFGGFDQYTDEGECVMLPLLKPPLRVLGRRVQSPTDAHYAETLLTEPFSLQSRLET